MAGKIRVAIVGCESVDPIDVCMLAKRCGADEILLTGSGNRILAEVVNRLRLEGSANKFAKVIAAPIGEAARADVVVIAGGPGSKRADGWSIGVLEVAANVRKDIRDLVGSGFDGVLLITVYPTDIMTQIAQAESGLPAGRVIGIGLQGNEWYSTHGSVGATVWCSAVCSNVQFFDDCDPECAHFLSPGVRHKPVENTGDPDGLATCVSGICEAILRDQNQIYPVSIMVERPGAVDGVSMTVPCVLGRAGVKATVERPKPSNRTPEMKLYPGQHTCIIQELTYSQKKRERRGADHRNGRDK